ncbi:MAG: DNA replication/repair protein RecF [Pseudomonadota bacterium]|nr:DNA replication/repair protein RecF [Pseudomonadota bacterium]
MALDRIRLSHFRNHAGSEISGTARFNLLIGENGAGKTNVLEAISLLAPGRGLRRAALSDMVMNHAAGGFAVSADLNAGGRAGEPIHIGTGTLPDRPGRRVVQINGADSSAMGLSEWLGLFWLTPAMDRLFMDSPGARRRFLDRMVLALEPAHARNASRYEAGLRERARLLFAAEEPDPHWLDAIEAQLAQVGAELSGARMRLIERLRDAIGTLPPSPFARPELVYQPGGPADAAALAQALADSRRRDRMAQRSLVGPHRDELLVTLAAKNQPAAECSTGEQKAMLIAITLAHSNLGAHSNLADNNTPPRARVLLLDEVAAHLDPLRREALFEQLRDGPAQVWITGTEAAPFAAIRDEAACWRVLDGVVGNAGFDHEL